MSTGVEELAATLALMREYGATEVRLPSGLHVVWPARAGGVPLPKPPDDAAEGAKERQRAIDRRARDLAEMRQKALERFERGQDPLGGG